MTKTWQGFKAGDRIVMLVPTHGCTPDDRELTYPAGTPAIVDTLRHFGQHQGRGVDVAIGTGNDSIVNSFDDRDIQSEGKGANVFFRHA